MASPAQRLKLIMIILFIVGMILMPLSRYHGKHGKRRKPNAAADSQGQGETLPKLFALEEQIMLAESSCLPYPEIEVRNDAPPASSKGSDGRRILSIRK